MFIPLQLTRKENSWLPAVLNRAATVATVRVVWLREKLIINKKFT